jgi:signal transduction histidine kinase/DNA-binding response OmpR family regulator
MKKLSLLLWLSLSGSTVCVAQPAILRLERLPLVGIVLKQGWKWHAGDNSQWATPNYDDRNWIAIDPTQDLAKLPQVQRAKMGWLRLRVAVGPALQGKAVGLMINQWGASEIYLNGQLIRRFGKVSPHPLEVDAYNPSGEPIAASQLVHVPLAMDSLQVLAVRFALQPDIPFIRYLTPANPLLSIRLNAADRMGENNIVSRGYFDITAVDYFKGGLFLILGLLHLIFYLLHPRQKANLHFGLYCLLAAVFNPLNSVSFQLLHDLEQRVVLQLCLSFLFVLQFGVLLTAVYSLVAHRKGPIYWCLSGAVVLLGLLTVRAYFSGTIISNLGILLSVLLNLDAVRVSFAAALRRKEGAAAVALGGLGYALFVSGYLLNELLTTNALHKTILQHTFANLGTLSLPLAITFYLAREFARTSLSLEAKLDQIKHLSAQTLAQQQEKQQMLALQNETLERKVTERTAEIVAQKEELLATLEQLRTAQEKLKQLDAQKTRFFDNITHEFRTPLTLILAPVEHLLLTTASTSSQYPYLQSVERNARQLLRLINQLLDLSRLEATTLPVIPTRGNINYTTKLVVETFRPAAEQKQVRLLYLTDEVEQEHLFDAEKWEKIVGNLLANAFKFTPAGGEIRVEVRLTDAALCTLRVADTGIGIAPEKLPHIFDRFYQADNSRTRAYEGSGIGLSLVKELIQLLGGSVQVESTPGKGTLFTLQVPLQPVTGSETAPLATPRTLPTEILDTAFLNRKNQQSVKPLLLLVEDNAEMVAFLSQTLSDDYSVLTAANGREGVIVARRELPEIVLSDVMMPEMDGYALCEVLKSDPVTDHIAVLLLTARTSQESRLEGLSLRADDYITKPFHLGELRLRLRNLLERQEKLREHFQRQWADATGFVQAQPLSDAFLTRLYQVLESHLDDSEFDPEALASQVAMSVRTLSRKLNALTGISPAKFIRLYRLRRAVQLLQAGHSVSETAYQIGFDNPSYFATAFKEHYQKTPSEYLPSA